MEYSRRFYIFLQKKIYLKKKNCANFKISENNISSVKAAKAVGYLEI
jgi:hypothetical protein